ncbi:C1 family peptidase, partial [uncultured Methanobrevibacter sp.]|uniref:C1 family peptidase n=1 Tax=uncultured Methanobrevibacter sp. TaxID=253161 RepID=UPI0026100514
MKNVKFIALFSILCLLIVIPATFAGDNDTAILASDAIQEDDAIAVNSSAGDNLADEYYFDANAENDAGNGSYDNPYKELTSTRVNDNSIIHLSNGEYEWDPFKGVSNVSIIGQSAENTIIRGGDGPGLRVSERLLLQNVTLVDFTISVNTGTQVNITNAVFKDSFSGSGGALNIMANSTVSIDNCTFSNNSANEGGSIYAKNAFLIISNSRFIKSTAREDAGGAIYLLKSSLNASNIEIVNSSATFGAAITALKSNLTINNLTAKLNNAKYNGGAIYSMYGNVIIGNSSFLNNSAKNGAALFLTNLDNATLCNISFTDNMASGTAAAYVIMDNITLVNITFMGNQALFDNDYYQTSMPDLNIGNGNYTLITYDRPSNGTLPSSYDLRLLNHVTPVKNQGSGGNCWAFAAIAALESCILKATGQEYDLSEENVKNLMALYSDYGWKMETNTGGYDKMGVGYLTGWLGPVYDVDDVYSGQSLLSGVMDSIVHVQNIICLQRSSYTDNDEIKRAIMDYGAVSTSIYWSGSYAKGKNYYYNGDTGANHAVAIVGWDDNYSRTNFRTTPQGDGAWIIKNSWGTSSGDKGYYYVSYYDTKFAPLNNPEKTFTFILNDTIKFDKNYQYDIPGKTDYFLNSSSTVWYKNKFISTGNEYLAAVSTYFEKNTNWDLSIYVNNVLRHTQSGVAHSGYSTIDLNNMISLRIGDVFEVVFKITVDGEAAFPISEAVSLNHKMYSENISFLSYDGENWVDLYNLTWNYSTHKYNSQVACIKAFTILNPVGTSISINCTFYNNPSVITAKVLNQYGNVVRFGNITFEVDGDFVSVPIVNGIATLNYSVPTSGYIPIRAYYSNNGYVSSNATIEKIDMELDIVKNIVDAVINVNLSKNINDTIYIKLNNDSAISVPVINGFGSLNLTDLYRGNYSVLAFCNSCEYYYENASTSFTIDYLKTFIKAENVVYYYNGTISYSIKLVDKLNQTIQNKSIIFSVNGMNMTATTNERGIACVSLNLNPGNYTIDIISNNESICLMSNATKTISVLSTIILCLDTKFTLNSKYEATLLDCMGNPLSNVNVSII